MRGAMFLRMMDNLGLLKIEDWRGQNKVRNLTSPSELHCRSPPEPATGTRCELARPGRIPVLADFSWRWITTDSLQRGSLILYSRS